MAENRNPDTVDIDLMDSLEIARSINREDTKVAAAVSQVLPDVARTIDLAAEALRSGGRLGYFGAGTSGKIAILDATDCPQTFGIDENLIQSFIAGGDECIRASVNGAEDNAELAVKDLETFNAGAGDVVVGISASGNPAYVVSVLAEARRRGAKTVAVTSNPQAKFKPYADVFINPLVGSEAIDGSSRMKSGSAQKMILNMISTGAMIRLGKTYENLMIDVNVSNEKLYRRALDMIERITGVNRGVAEKCLLAADKNVKTACVMAAMNCPPKPKGFWRKTTVLCAKPFSKEKKMSKKFSVPTAAKTPLILYGRHAVTAALANPERKIAKLLCTAENAPEAKKSVRREACPKPRSTSSTVGKLTAFCPGMPFIRVLRSIARNFPNILWKTSAFWPQTNRTAIF